MKPILYIENDMNPQNARLANLAKKTGVKVVSVQNTLFAYDKDIEYYIDTVNANTKFPKWIPFRKKLVWLRKWVGHIWYYRTFRSGKSSYILRRGCSGMRDADVQTYLCEQQKQIFIKNGVPESKLVLGQIFSRKPETILKKVITVLIPSDNTGGVDRTTKKFISYNEQLVRWLVLFKEIKNKYPDHKFLLKFHYNTKNFDEIYPLFKNEDENVLCFKGIEWDNYCVDEASIIYGLPPSLSTILYKASVEYPNKEIYSVDIGNEMFGDYFEGYDNIKVIKKI